MTPPQASEAAVTWQPIETAPVSTPMEQVFFLAYCPDDPWAPLGRVHVACKYANDEADRVQVIGSPQKRRATHWALPTEPLQAPTP